MFLILASCGVLTDKFINYLIQIFNIIRIASPIIVVVFTIYEFAKAVFAQDKSENNKALNRLIKRLILAAILFATPTLVNILLTFISNTNGTCGI